MCYTPTDQEHTHQRKISTKLSKMLIKPLRSSLTGPRAGVGKEQPSMAPATYVCNLFFSLERICADDPEAVGAHEAFEEALNLDPANAQAQSGLEAVKRAMDAEASSDGIGGGAAGLGNMFSDPQLFQKLARNPKTSGLLADPTFMAKLQRLRSNPNSIGQEMSDPRFLQVMSVLLGIDMSFGDPSSGLGGVSDLGDSKESEEDAPMPDARPSSSQPPPPSKAPEPEPEAEPEDAEAAQSRKAKEEADAEKKLGTEFYKKRQFDPAIEHYAKAWELHKDITYLTNLSAAKYEKGDYEGAIQDCQQAIEEGREVLTDFKIIAKYGNLH